jgi:hypothetical protein
MCNHPKINPSEKGKEKRYIVDAIPMTNDTLDRQCIQGGDEGTDNVQIDKE